ncbi:MAG: hypothetical protein JOZ69_20305 [Myxococcales bacterium]|nr:hypothetical protein [Myxococcales bacterium]
MNEEPLEPMLVEALRRDRELSPPDDARARIASRLGIAVDANAVYWSDEAGNILRLAKPAQSR